MSGRRSFQAEAAACTEAQRQRRQKAQLVSGVQGPPNGWSTGAGECGNRRLEGQAEAGHGGSSRELGFHSVGRGKQLGKAGELLNQVSVLKDNLEAKRKTA